MPCPLPHPRLKDRFMPDITVPSAQSDLTGRALFPHRHLLSIAALKPWEIRFLLDAAENCAKSNRGGARKPDDRLAGMPRSDERSVGTECGRTCRSRG